MNNVWRLFRFDLGRLKANVMSIIITLGLVLVPSLFAWYNIIACWNVFDNTATSRWPWPTPTRATRATSSRCSINIGDQVVSALRANDQIDWQFTDENDAIDGAKSGRYYAAVVIPKSFSRDMLTFYTADAGPCRYRLLRQREEERHRAEDHRPGSRFGVLPGERRVRPDALGGVALAGRIAFQLRRRGRLGRPHRGGGRPCARDGRRLRRRVRGAFALRLAGSLLRGSLAPFGRPGHPGLHGPGRDAVRRDGAADAVPATVDALKGSADTLKSSLADSAAAFGAVSDSVDALFDAASGDSKDIAGDLRAQADALASHATVYRQVADSLEGAAPSLPESLRPQVTALAGRARAVASQADSMAASLRTAADKLEAGDTDLSAERDAAKAKAAEAAASVNSIKDDYEAHVAPGLASLAEQAASMADALSGVSDDLKGVGGELSSSATSAADVMAGHRR